jgi:hypothetical protein
MLEGGECANELHNQFLNSIVRNTGQGAALIAKLNHWHRDLQPLQESVRGSADRAGCLLLAAALKHLNRTAIGTVCFGGNRSRPWIFSSLRCVFVVLWSRFVDSSQYVCMFHLSACLCVCERERGRMERDSHFGRNLRHQSTSSSTSCRRLEELFQDSWKNWHYEGARRQCR